jgi:hypothetical protein
VPESWSAKNKRLAREKAAREKAAREQPAAGTGKRKYTRRGPVCPDCGATMDVNPKDGKAHCPFASSHRTAKAVRDAGATQAGTKNRGRAQPPDERAKSQQALAKGRSLWKTRKDPGEGKGS